MTSGGVGHAADRIGTIPAMSGAAPSVGGDIGIRAVKQTRPMQPLRAEQWNPMQSSVSRAITLDRVLEDFGVGPRSRVAIQFLWLGRGDGPNKPGPGRLT